MGLLSELFVATHAEAVERADVLESGAVPVSIPHVELTEIAPEDLETLGEVAARRVRFGTGDVEVSEVDLAHDSLYRLSDFMAEVLAELAGSEEDDAVADVAEAWAKAMAEGAEDGADAVPAEHLEPVVRAIADLAVAAADADRALHLWVHPV